MGIPRTCPSRQAQQHTCTYIHIHIHTHAQTDKAKTMPDSAAGIGWSYLFTCLAFYLLRWRALLTYTLCTSHLLIGDISKSHLGGPYLIKAPPPPIRCVVRCVTRYDVFSWECERYRKANTHTHREILHTQGTIIHAHRVLSLTVCVYARWAVTDDSRARARFPSTGTVYTVWNEAILIKSMDINNLTFGSLFTIVRFIRTC